MKKFIAAASLASALALAVAPVVGQTPAPVDASVYFVNIKDGDTLTNPVRIQFGLKGMGVAPAGVEKEKTGHHHLIINEKVEGDKLKAPLPTDEKHVHFGGGQTEVTITLPAGQHTLQLVLGDWSHVPHNPPVMSPRITVTVK
jgi:Domain of unknown function (DUF4399)